MLIVEIRNVRKTEEVSEAREYCRSCLPVENRWSWIILSHEGSQPVSNFPLNMYCTLSTMLGTVHVAVASRNMSHSEFLKVKHINNVKSTVNNVTTTDETDLQPYC